jgi:hypothetical protein
MELNKPLRFRADGAVCFVKLQTNFFEIGGSNLGR